MLVPLQRKKRRLKKNKMEPEDTPPKPTLKELLERYDIEGMETPFKEWFHRAIEQEYGVSAESASIVMAEDDARATDDTYFVDTKKEKDKTVFKLGELVRRKSFISEGEVGIVTRVDKIKQLDDNKGKHSKKYMVTFQQTSEQLWFNADQLERLKAT